jgi:hypothetical protein
MVKAWAHGSKKPDTLILFKLQAGTFCPLTRSRGNDLCNKTS